MCLPGVTTLCLPGLTIAIDRQTVCVCLCYVSICSYAGSFVLTIVTRIQSVCPDIYCAAIVHKVGGLQVGFGWSTNAYWFS